MGKKEKETVDTNECQGPLVEQCEKCEQFEECLKGQLRFYSQIPYWIIDSYLAVLSGTAFKVFVYLVRKANFDPKSNHFGRCSSRKEIADAAGVSETNLSKQMKELESHGLITRCKNQPFRKSDGSWGSSRMLTVTHFGRMKELKAKKA